MRTKSLTMVVTLLLMAGAAAAQDGATPAAQPDVAKAEKSSSSSEFPIVNVLDIGVRGTSFGSDSDPARFQRYRDVRDGGTVDRFRLFKDTNAYRYNLQADHVGYRDQRYSGTYTNYGKVKASFEWNQIPLYYSNSTQTLYDTSTPGTLSINDSIQSGIQNKTLALGTALNGRPGVRSPHQARHCDRQRGLQRDAQCRCGLHASQHAEAGRVSVGWQLRHLQRHRLGNAGAGRSSHHGSGHQPRILERPRVCATGVRRVVLQEQRHDARL